MSTIKHPISLESPTGKWTLLSCILATSMAFIDTTALNVVLPSLQRDLNATGIDLFWVLNSYLLVLSALILVGGSLGDILGRVKIFKWGILIFTAASALCGLSQTIEQLILFRSIQGLGGAMMIPGSLSIISATFSDSEKGKAIGTWSAATTLVTMGAPALGGALADWGLWRMIFFINLPVGLISLYLLQTRVPESKASDEKQAIDWWGALVLTLSLASFTFGLLNIPEWGMEAPLSYGPAILGVALLFVFIWVERVVDQPMVPLGIFLNRCFAGVNLLTFFLYAGLGGLMLFVSLNMIQVQGYSQLEAGMTFLPFPIIMALTARRIGGLSDRWGTRRFLIVGPTVTGIGFLVMGQIGLTNGPTDFWTTFLPGIVIFSLGMAITVVPLTTTVMRSLPDQQAGIASGVNNSVTRVASTLINAVIGAGGVFLFIQLVEMQVADLGLTQLETDQVLQEALNLGEAESPTNLTSDVALRVQRIYDLGFVTTYQLIAYGAAALAFLSALFAVFMVRDFRVKG